MTWLFDSHIHLSDPDFDNEMDFTIRCMQKLQIKACCVSMDNENSKKTLELAKKSDLILPFIGIHPEKSNDDLEAMTNLISENSKNITGIGEIGLDRSYTNSDEEFMTQKKVFETLLSQAEEFEKPVSIHSRKALDEILEILPSFSTKKILLHWFDGNKKQLRRSMDMGLYVSYGPVLVYAHDKQSLLSRTDITKILVETDGPVRFSKCFGLKTAQLSFIPSVVFCAAKVLSKSYDEFAEILETNSTTYLGI